LREKKRSFCFCSVKGNNKNLNKPFLGKKRKGKKRKKKFVDSHRLFKEKKCSPGLGKEG